MGNLKTMETLSTDIKKLTYHDEAPTKTLDTIADAMALEFKPAKKSLKLIVTVPAHNEEADIPACLKALADQEVMVGTKIDYESYEVIVLCHNCSDRTMLRCKEIQYNYPFLNLLILEVNRPEVNNVGAVRRIGMRIAASRLTDDSGYITTTDADTITDRHYIANLLGYLGSGYGLICGRINIDMTDISGNAEKTLIHKQSYFVLRTRLEHLISPDKKNPWPRHSHNSGPNLSIRRDVYNKIGGMPPKGFLEDIALYDAVCESGYAIRHCPFTIVTTSGRMEPRAPWGFGSELKDWSEAESIFFKVEGLKRLLAKFGIFRRVREYFQSPSKEIIEAISKESKISMATVIGYFIEFSNPGPVINRIDRQLDNLKSWNEKYPLKLVHIAERELQDYFDNPSFNFSQI
mgnify:CR=1 FL=1